MPFIIPQKKNGLKEKYQECLCVDIGQAVKINNMKRCQ